MDTYTALGQQLKKKLGSDYAGYQDDELGRQYAQLNPDYATATDTALGYQPAQQQAAPLPAGQVADTGSFGGNVLNSGGHFLGGLFSAISHPVSTLSNLGALGVGLGTQAYNAVTGSNANPGGAVDTARAVEQSYANRYGHGNLGRTLYTDPVGVLGDAAGVLGGVGGIAGKVGDIADIGALSGAGDAASSVANLIDPTQNALRFASVPVKGALSLGARMVGGDSAPALNALVSGNSDLAQAARQGMRGQQIDPSLYTAPKDAGFANLADSSLAAGRDGGLNLTPTYQNAIKLVADGTGATVKAIGPEQMQQLTQDLEHIQNPPPISDEHAIRNYQQAMQRVSDAYTTLGLSSASPDISQLITEGLNRGRYRVPRNYTGPALTDVQGAIQQVIGNNGYSGIDWTGSSVQNPAAQGAIEGAMKQLFTTPDAANPYVLDNIKQGINSLYARIPSTNADLEANRVVSQLAGAAKQPLMESPEYAAAQRNYATYKSGQNLANVLPNSSQIGRDVLLAALGHATIGVPYALSALVESPRALGETYNALGRVGNATATAAGNPALNTLLAQLGITGAQ